MCFGVKKDQQRTGINLTKSKLLARTLGIFFYQGTQSTLMSYGANSRAAACVKPRTAHLEVEYATVLPDCTTTLSVQE